MGKYNHQNKYVDNADTRKLSSSDSYLDNYENSQVCDHGLFAASSQDVVNPATNTGENSDNRRREEDTESTSVFGAAGQDDGFLYKEKSASQDNNTLCKHDDDSGISL